MVRIVEQFHFGNIQKADVDTSTTTDADADHEEHKTLTDAHPCEENTHTARSTITHARLVRYSLSNFL